MPPFTGKRKLAVVGAGGHGKVVADLAAALGRYREIVFLDDRAQGSVNGFSVIGTTLLLENSLSPEQYDVAVEENANSPSSVRADTEKSLPTLPPHSAGTGKSFFWTTAHKAASTAFPSSARRCCLKTVYRPNNTTSPSPSATTASAAKSPKKPPRSASPCPFWFIRTRPSRLLQQSDKAASLWRKPSYRQAAY